MNYKYAVFLLLFFSFYFAKAQNVSKAVFHLGDTEIKSVDITENGFILTIDNKGNLVSFNSIAGGDYQYFDEGYGSVECSRDGKVKTIGNMKIDYWITDLLSGKKGKVKSIGNILVDYWNDDLLNGGQGKLKSIGNMNIEYWTDDLLSGKLGKAKSMGNITVDYFTSDLLSSNYGRIKSINGNTASIYAVRN
jgi:hypothetical protein